MLTEKEINIYFSDIKANETRNSLHCPQELLQWLDQSDRLIVIKAIKTQNTTIKDSGQTFGSENESMNPKLPGMENINSKFKLKKTDYALEIIGIIGIISLIALPIYFFKQLPPDHIPKHFNSLGKADLFGGRALLWILPIIGIVLYIGMTLMNKFSFAFNYPPKKEKHEHAEKMYAIGKRTVRLLKVIIILSLSFLNYKLIEIGMHQTQNLGEFFLPLVLVILFAFLTAMIYRMIRK
ncbi:MAG TPA: DUF1648 domain-containing protein [Sunxiuqinia sp.]|nr:DUF1648 domain-containing protein [Sunxiuqinia sp.]